MAKKDSAAIQIPALQIETFKLRIVGDSPLISHAWSEKAKRMMLDKMTKKASTAKEIRRPAVDFANSPVLAEIIPRSKFGFPVIGFKAAAISKAFWIRKPLRAAPFTLSANLPKSKARPPFART